MPTYRYRCDRCGEQLDVWQSIHDASLRVHDSDCGGDLRKVLAMGGIVLKGSGFYRTDNRTGSKKEREGADSTAKPESKTNGAGDKDKNAGEKKPEKSEKPEKSDKPAHSSKSESSTR